MKNRILVADDEELIRTLVRDFLENAGYEVLEASNGQEAVDLFESTPGIQVVILDMMMPVLDGEGALKAIRKRSGVPVILLTARSEEQDEIDGLLMGADEYVTKPFSPRTLVARVDALVRRFTQYAGDASAASAASGAQPGVPAIQQPHPAGRKAFTPPEASYWTRMHIQ